MLKGGNAHTTCCLCALILTWGVAVLGRPERRYDQGVTDGSVIKDGSKFKYAEGWVEGEQACALTCSSYI